MEQSPYKRKSSIASQKILHILIVKFLYQQNANVHHQEFIMVLKHDINVVGL